MIDILPSNANFIRGLLNQIAGSSEKNFGYSTLAKIAAFSIPIIALTHVPLYALRATTGFASHLAEGEIKQAFVKLLSDSAHALQMLAFTIVSLGWALFGFFCGSRVLTYFRSELSSPVDLPKQIDALNNALELPPVELRVYRTKNRTMLKRLSDSD